jgi:hypothetical protein
VFVERVMVPFIKHHDIDNANIFIDSATCHKSTAVEQQFKQSGIKTHFIPPGLTNILQPADVVWFSSIKKQLHNRWTDWSYQ